MIYDSFETRYAAVMDTGHTRCQVWVMSGSFWRVSHLFRPTSLSVVWLSGWSARLPRSLLPPLKQSRQILCWLSSAFCVSKVDLWQTQLPAVQDGAWLCLLLSYDDNNFTLVISSFNRCMRHSWIRIHIVFFFRVKRSSPTFQVCLMHLLMACYASALLPPPPVFRPEITIPVRGDVKPQQSTTGSRPYALTSLILYVGLPKQEVARWHGSAVASGSVCCLRLKQESVTLFLVLTLQLYVVLH